MADRVAPASPISAGLVFTLGLLAATAPLSLDAYLPALPAIAAEFGVSRARGSTVLHRLPARPRDRSDPRRSSRRSMGSSWTDARRHWPLRDLIPRLRDRAHFGHLHRASPRSGSGWRRRPGAFARGCPRPCQGGERQRRCIRNWRRFPVPRLCSPPIAGGLIIDLSGWRVVFVVLAGLGIVMAVAVYVVVGDTHPADKRTTAGLTTVLRRFGGLLRDRSFAAFATVVMLSSAVLFSYIASSPFVLQAVYGLTQLQFALSFAAVGSGLVAASLVNARLVRRHDPLLVLRMAAIVQIVGIAALSALITVRLVSGWTSIPLLIVLLMWSVVPCGFITPTGVSLAMARSGDHAGRCFGPIGGEYVPRGRTRQPALRFGRPGGDHGNSDDDFQLRDNRLHARAQREATTADGSVAREECHPHPAAMWSPLSRSPRRRRAERPSCGACRAHPRMGCRARSGTWRSGYPESTEA